MRPIYIFIIYIYIKLDLDQVYVPMQYIYIWVHLDVVIAWVCIPGLNEVIYILTGAITIARCTLKPQLVYVGGCKLSHFLKKKNVYFKLESEQQYIYILL